MRINHSLMIVSLLGFLPSCALQPVALPPVGPRAAAMDQSDNGLGSLEVFSQLNEEIEGDNPIFYQHSDYNLYTADGKFLRHIDNTVGHYSQAPRLVALRPGRYVINARAEECISVDVPVVIEPCRTTKVHLDEKWNPPPGTKANAVVSIPGGGSPVGWRANSTHLSAGIKAGS